MNEKLAALKGRNKILALFISCGGFGYVKKGSGTVTSVVSLLMWVPMLKLADASLYILGACVLLTVLGALASRKYEALVGGHDLSEVTIDEWVGMGLSLSFAKPVFWQIGAAFILFRLFDIWKPIGVRYFDRNYLNGWGVILDDVVAGIYAALCLGILQWLIA